MKIKILFLILCQTIFCFIANGYTDSLYHRKTIFSNSQFSIFYQEIYFHDNYSNKNLFRKGLPHLDSSIPFKIIIKTKYDSLIVSTIQATDLIYDSTNDILLLLSNKLILGMPNIMIIADKTKVSYYYKSFWCVSLKTENYTQIRTKYYKEFTEIEKMNLIQSTKECCIVCPIPFVFKNFDKYSFITDTLSKYRDTTYFYNDPSFTISTSQEIIWYIDSIFEFKIIRESNNIYFKYINFNKKNELINFNLKDFMIIYSDLIDIKTNRKYQRLKNRYSKIIIRGKSGTNRAINIKSKLERFKRYRN